MATVLRMPDQPHLSLSIPHCRDSPVKRRKSIHSPRTPKSTRPFSRHPKNPPYAPGLTTIVSQEPTAYMNSRPSAAPWADGPYPLIPAPRRQNETPAAFVAAEMAITHNVFLRGLNSILRQAPYIADSLQPGYDARDVEDLLRYTNSWAKLVRRHHRLDETKFYPDVEQVTGITGLMDDMIIEHEEWLGGLESLLNYIDRIIVRPNQYRWATMRTMINSFAPALTNHLYSEIDFLLGLEQFDCHCLRGVWFETEKTAKSAIDNSELYDIFPFVLGQWDYTYEGRKTFPEIYAPIRYSIKHFFAKKYQGAWRFNCCDVTGKPQPLQMLPQNRK